MNSAEVEETPAQPDGLGALLARRTSRDRSDTIRQILAAATAEGVLSLAGGIPAPDSFPVSRMAAAVDRVMTRTPVAALQYAPTEGVPSMRETLARLASSTGASVGADQVVVISGSQQGLDLITQVLLDEGDSVALEDPGYLGAVQIFRRAGVQLLPVPGDQDGMRTDILAERLSAGARCKAVYVVPQFHNPTGAVLAPERRRHLAELADQYGFVIIEDDPYADLAFDGRRLPSIDTHSDRVVRLLSLSKTVCPGLRVASMVAPRALIGELVTAKQCNDLQTNTFGQYVLTELLADPSFLPGHIRTLQELYRSKAEALADRLSKHLPWLSFDEPRGGLFLWCSITDPEVSADRLYPIALAEGVAFVPGSPFCIDRDGSQQLRLSYATLDEDQRSHAVDRLSTAFGKALAGPGPSGSPA